MKDRWSMRVGRLDHPEEDSGARGDRYDVQVSITTIAENPEEAEEIINKILQEGILRFIDEEGKEPIEEYDIEDVEPSAF